MKGRSSLYTILSLLFAVLLIGWATAAVTGYRGDPAVWWLAHRQMPVLWLVNLCALYTIILVQYLNHHMRAAELRDQEIRKLREASQRKWDEILDQNEVYAARLAQLISASQAQQEAFVAEVRKLTEQAHQALQGQMEANKRQIEALNMAMRYQREELRTLRRAVLPGEEPQDAPPLLDLPPSETVAEALRALPTREAYTENGGKRPESSARGSSETEKASAIGSASESSQTPSSPTGKRRKATKPVEPEPETPLGSNGKLSAMPMDTLHAVVEQEASPLRARKETVAAPPLHSAWRTAWVETMRSPAEPAPLGRTGDVFPKEEPAALAVLEQVRAEEEALAAVTDVMPEESDELTDVVPDAEDDADFNETMQFTVQELSRPDPPKPERKSLLATLTSWWGRG